ASGLFSWPGMMELGRVDADVSDPLDARADPDMDRVTVDDADDRALDERGRARPRAGSEGEQRQNGEQARRAEHAVTVSRAASGCQHSDTPGRPATDPDPLAVARDRRGTLPFPRCALRRRAGASRSGRRAPRG